MSVLLFAITGIASLNYRIVIHNKQGFINISAYENVLHWSASHICTVLSPLVASNLHFGHKHSGTRGTTHDRADESQSAQTTVQSQLLTKIHTTHNIYKSPLEKIPGTFR